MDDTLRAQVDVHIVKATETYITIPHLQALSQWTKGDEFPPIQWIPPEILGIIFAHCVIPISSNPHVTTSQIRPSSAPLLLTRVCRSWRAVTFATPILWTVIHVGKIVIRSRQLPAIISRWLQNSGQLPLSIRVLDSAGGISRRLLRPILEEKEYLDAMKLIRNELHRCRMLMLCSLSRTSIPVAHLIPHNTCMPSLEELVIDRFSNPVNIALDAPKLRSVNFICKVSPHQVSTIVPISHSLVSLQISCDILSGNEFLHFAQFPQLDNLVCSCYTFCSPSGDFNVTLQSLTVLKLSFTDSDSPIVLFLSHLRLPSLCHLRLFTNRAWDPTEDGEDIRHLTTSNLDLSRLQVLDLDIDMTRSSSALIYMTSLEKLVITGRRPGLVHTLYSLARPLDDGRWLCPRLKALDLLSRDPKSLEALLEVIAARGLDPAARDLTLPLEAVRPLLRVEFAMMFHGDMVLVERLEAMGVELE